VGSIELRYKYRLRVNSRRAALLNETFAACRFVWNTSVGRWNDLWRHESVNLSEKDMHAELTDWRCTYDWLAAVPVTPQQQAIIDLRRSIRAYFDKSNPAGRPKFKKKGTTNSARWTTRGFGITGTGLGLRGDRLSLALPGGREDIPVVWSRALPSEPKSVTVYRDAEGYWWASFVIRVEPETVNLPQRNTGLDVGLTVLVTASDETGDVPNPRFSRKERKALARHDKRQGRGRRDQQVSAKTKQRRARAHGRVARRRLDHHHKTARRIARSYAQIGVEDLRIKNMLANRHLSRAISDAGWGIWLGCLEHQRRKIGETVEYRDPRGTTQNCSDCGTKTKTRLGLSDRVFVCHECGAIKDRDRNAAHNLEPGRTRPGVALRACKPVEPCGVPGSLSHGIPRL
jgi:putative transposase